jgi:hypothetical protein
LAFQELQSNIGDLDFVGVDRDSGKKVGERNPSDLNVLGTKVSGDNKSWFMNEINIFSPLQVSAENSEGIEKLKRKRSVDENDERQETNHQSKNKLMVIVQLC